MQAARQNRSGIELVVDASELAGELGVDVGGEGLVADLLMLQLRSADALPMDLSSFTRFGGKTNLRRAISDSFQPVFNTRNLQTRVNEHQLRLCSADAQAYECHFGGFVDFQLAFDRGQDFGSVAAYTQ